MGSLVCAYAASISGPKGHPSLFVFGVCVDFKRIGGDFNILLSKGRYV
jgi:hypothetical protein